MRKRKKEEEKNSQTLFNVSLILSVSICPFRTSTLYDVRLSYYLNKGTTFTTWKLMFTVTLMIIIIIIIIIEK